MMELDYTPLDDRKGYVDLDSIRLVVEDGKLVGWFAPDGLEEDPAITFKRSSND